jgi:3-hydroxyacyl-CoA dehydrogenase
MWDRIANGAVEQTSYQRPRLTGVSNATTEQLHAAGWYERQFEMPPDGQRIVERSWEGVQDGRSFYRATKTEPIPEPPEPDPRDVEIAALKTRLDKIEGDVTTLKAERITR